MHQIPYRLTFVVSTLYLFMLHRLLMEFADGGLIFLEKNTMIDLKVIKSVLEQLEEERGIPKEKIVEAIESALATAYKKEYGKRGQIVRADFNMDTGTAEFFQVKIVVDESKVYFDPENAPEYEEDTPEEERKTLYNPEHHILLEDAKRIKADAELDAEIVFPLEMKDDYGRISAQTAKQVIIQKIR